MASRILWIFSVFCALFTCVKGKDCVPKSVVNVSLSLMGMLSWAVGEDEICDITHFRVYMSHPDAEPNFVYESDTTTMNVDMLMACQFWHINIVPHVNDVEGQGHLFITRMPVPQDEDLVIENLNITQPKGGDPYLEWQVHNPIFGECSLRFRVSVAGADGEVITEYYTDEKKMNLHFLSPCVTYEFGVSSVNIAPPVMEGNAATTLYYYPPVVNTPHLQTVERYATSLNFTWGLESYFANRCEVNFLRITGTAINATIGFKDTPDRPPINIPIVGLKPNTMYYFNVSAGNEAGFSQAIQVAVQTLPSE